MRITPRSTRGFHCGQRRVEIRRLSRFLHMCVTARHQMAAMSISVKAPYGAIGSGNLPALRQALAQDETLHNITSADDGSSGFRADVVHSALKTSRMGHLLLHASELPSTQDTLKRHQSVLLDGTLCLAMRQLSGRGRRDNQWKSPVGCLMFSVYTRFEFDPTLSPFLNYIVCLAIARAIEKLSFKKLSGHCVRVDIKWPNDIYYQGLKIGGILLQSSLRGKEFQLITGIGLNVLNERPTTCLSSIFKEHVMRHGLEEMDDPLTLEDTLAEILNELEPLFDHFAENGFDEATQNDYLERWIHSDQTLQIESSSVTIKGIAQSGFLLAQTETGETIELFPDGNSIDMLQGLIMKRT